MKTKAHSIVCVLVLGLSLTLVWLLTSAHSPGVQASPKSPTTSVIYVNSEASGPSDGLTWSTAFTNVQEALTNAEPGDEIWVAEGVYTPTYRTDAGDARSATFVLTDSVALYGGFVATETLRTQRDWEAHVTVLSGDLDGNDITDENGVTVLINGSNAYHVVTGSGVTTTSVLDGFTITAGRANGSSPNNCGGGMYSSGGSPTLTNVTFSGNSASLCGGGMSNGSSSGPVLSNASFYGNIAGDNGGGMCNGNDSNPILINTIFDSNSAGSFGGGMFNVLSSPTLTGATFSDNSAYSGGGMDNHLSHPTLTDVTFSNNDARQGGGMYNIDFSSPRLTDVVFVGNSASYGGGMYNHYSYPQLTHASLLGNSATHAGGGLYSTSGSSMLINVILSGNTANSGGGMYSSRTSLTLTNTSFSGNSATLGGGVYNYSSTTTMVNCILWGNEASGSTDQLAQIFLTNTSPITITYSLVQGGVYTGTGNISADPLFIRNPDPGLDGTWGTSDDDHGDLRLLLSSPAIDAGDNGALPSGLTADLDGYPRRFDAASVPDTGNGTPPIVDLGAYEWHLYDHEVLLPLVLRD